MGRQLVCPRTSQHQIASYYPKINLHKSKHRESAQENIINVNCSLHQPKTEGIQLIGQALFGLLKNQSFYEHVLDVFELSLGSFFVFRELVKFGPYFSIFWILQFRQSAKEFSSPAVEINHHIRENTKKVDFLGITN